MCRRIFPIIVILLVAIAPLLPAMALDAEQLREDIMPFSHFLAASSLRVFRVAGALYLIVLGLLTVSG